MKDPRARTTGAVYLLFFLTAILGAIVTPGTPNDILAHESSFRWGFAVSLVSLAFYVALTALFYNLFRPVSRNLALLGAAAVAGEDASRLECSGRIRRHRVFGVLDILIGMLIFKSTFLPRILGVLMVIAGVLWLSFLTPPLANHVLVVIAVAGFVAELALMRWLLVRGVNVQRWTELAGAAG